MQCNECGRDGENHACSCSARGKALRKSTPDFVDPGFNLVWVGVATLALFAFVGFMALPPGRLGLVLQRVLDIF